MKNKDIKIFMLGDFLSNNGIGVGNRTLLVGMTQYSVKISKCSKRVSRIIEMLIKVIWCDALFLCSPTKMNIIAIIYAKMLRKKIYYRAHGFITFDKNLHSKSILKTERFVFDYCDKVFWVSKKAMESALLYNQNYKTKFSCIYNAIDFSFLEKTINEIDVERSKNIIFSIGGGRKQKNNHTVAKAIDLLNQSGLDISYVIVGTPHDGLNDLLKYKCVKYIGEVTHEEVLYYMKHSWLFICNSNFDTYSISTVEALFCGCSLLLSNNIGAIETFDNLNESDIIFDNFDEHEIAKKIQILIEEPNQDRLKHGFQRGKLDAFENGKKMYQAIIDN